MDEEPILTIVLRSQVVIKVWSDGRFLIGAGQASAIIRDP